MAGDLTPNDVIQASNSNETASQVQNTGNEIKTSLKGLEEMTGSELKELGKKLEKSLGKFQKAILSQIKDESNEFSALRECAQDMLDGGKSDPLKTSAMQDMKVRAKKNPQVSDILKLSAQYSLGPLLLHSELVSIHKDLLKLVPNSSGRTRPTEELKGKAAVLSQLKGMPEMVKTLKEFAITMVIFRLFDSRIADNGMSIFANTLDKWEKLANKYKNSYDRWSNLTEVVEKMLEGIVSYTGAITLLAVTMPLALLAIPALALMGIFFKGMDIIGKLVKPAKKGMKDLAIVAILMSAAFIGFGISMLILSKIRQGFFPAIGGMVAISLTIGWINSLSKSIKRNLNNLKDFTIGVILISSSFLLFGATMKILGSIGSKIGWATLGMAAISMIIWETVGFANTIKGQKKNFIDFAQGVILIASSYLIFGIAMRAVTYIADHFGPVLLGMTFVSMLIFGTAKLSEHLKANMKNFKDFTLGAVLLGIAFMTIGLSFHIAASIVPILGQALKGLLAISVILVAAGVAANYMKSQMANFKTFAIGAVILGAAFMVFGIALNIISLIGNRALPAIGGLAIIAAALIGAIAASQLVKVGMVDFILFTVGAVILGVAFMAMGGAMLIVSKVGKQAGWALLGLATTAAFIAGAAGLGIGMTFLIPLLGVFTIGALALGAAFAALGGAMNLFAKLGTPEIQNKINLAVSNASQLFNGLGTIAKNINLLSMIKLRAAISILNDTTLAKLNHFAVSINKLSDAQGAIDKLNEFAMNADSFNSIATSFERMANAFDSISSKSGKVRSLFDTLSKAKMEVNTLTESTPVAMGGTTFDPAVTRIYDRLEDWNRNGVPIRANINGETLKISPNEVNNRTGIKTRSR